MTNTLDSVPFDRRRIALWVVALLLFGVLLVVFRRFVGPIMLGVFSYYATRPLYRRVLPVVRFRGVAAALTITLVTVPALVLFGWTLLLAVQELLAIVETEFVATYLEMAQEWLDAVEVTRGLPELAQRVAEGEFELGTIDSGALFRRTVAVLSAVVGVVGTVGVNAFVALIISFYLLRDDHRIAAWARNVLAGDDGVVLDFFRATDYNLKTIYFGNLVNAFFTGTIGTVTYYLLNQVAPATVSVPLPGLLGVLTGVASLIPIVGMKLVWVPTAIILLVQALVFDPGAVWFPLLFAAVSIVVVDTIPDLVLRPFVSGRRLHVGAVMLAYLFGPLMFGWYGIFLGPLLLVFVVEFARVIFPWLIDPSYRPERTAALVEYVDEDAGADDADAETDADATTDTDPGSGPVADAARPEPADADASPGSASDSGPDADPDSSPGDAGDGSASE